VQYVNAFSVLVSALATVVLVVVTGKYVGHASRMADEAHKTSGAQAMAVSEMRAGREAAERERNEEAARKDDDLRRALAADVEAFLRRWGPHLRDAVRGEFQNLQVLEPIAGDAAKFARFLDRLGDIRSEVQRGLAMKWCMDAGTIELALFTLATTPENPHPTAGTPAERATWARMRGSALAEIRGFLEVAEQLRPWLGFYDPGPGGDILHVPEPPPPGPRAR
jgi:hypothetical protein